jgi:hypothetical protein
MALEKVMTVLEWPKSFSFFQTFKPLLQNFENLKYYQSKKSKQSYLFLFG